MRTWVVEEKEGSCVIQLQDGTFTQENVPRTRLKSIMAGHGVSGELLEQLCRELDSTGKATVSAPAFNGAIRQVCP